MQLFSHQQSAYLITYESCWKEFATNSSPIDANVFILPGNADKSLVSFSTFDVVLLKTSQEIDQQNIKH